MSFFWKASVTPLMFHGVSGWEEDELGVDKREEIDERARGMMTKLGKNNEESLKFVRVKVEQVSYLPLSACF